MKPLLSPDEYLKFTVLYVDDEPLALETFKAQFSEDFSIATAENAEEALAYLEKNEVSILLSDQRMPGLSGVELLARVKEIHPDIIRMLITAYSDMDVVVEAINSGNVYRYVSKPYNEDEIRNTIRQGLETAYLIGERERLEAEKAENAKRMARANRLSAVGTLAAGMAHEINNPLTAVSAFLQMLPLKLEEKKKDSEYFGSFYERVCEELGRIQNLIARLLRYSKYGEQEEYQFRETKINDLLDDMILLLKPEAKQRGDRFKSELDADLPVVFTDADRIKQVFMNLILNAIQATEKGTITISTLRGKSKSGSEFVKISVKDTGNGIKDEHIQKLFDPFFTTKHHEGSGLGLLTCHHIIEAHGGALDVKSRPGEGATFTVQLPLDPRLLVRKKDSENPLRETAST